MLLAEWSGKSAVENQEDIILTLLIRQSEHVSGKIWK